MDVNKQFENYLKRLKNLYQRALWSYYCYEWLQEIKAPNIIWMQTAKRNIKTWHRFNNFFSITSEASRTFFFLELAKIFDTQDQAIKLAKIINIAKNNRRRLLNKDWKWLEKWDLNKIENLIKKNETIIQKLKDYRDQYICHDDTNKIKISINWNEIEKLLKIVAEIFNIFSLKIYASITAFDSWKNNFKNEVKNIFNNLNEIQIYKMHEIYKNILIHAPDAETKNNIKKQYLYKKNRREYNKLTKK